jgi:hypothetical protein
MLGGERRAERVAGLVRVMHGNTRSLVTCMHGNTRFLVTWHSHALLLSCSPAVCGRRGVAMPAGGHDDLRHAGRDGRGGRRQRAVLEHAALQPQICRKIGAACFQGACLLCSFPLFLLSSLPCLALPPYLDTPQRFLLAPERASAGCCITRCKEGVCSGGRRMCCLA